MPSKNKLRAVVADVMQPAYIVEIEPGLDGMQDAVKGHIELFTVLTAQDGGRLDCWCNEEGRIDGMRLNRLFHNFDIHGPILITSSDDEGETISLTLAQANEAVRQLNECMICVHLPAVTTED